VGFEADETQDDGDVPSRFQVDFTGRTLLGTYRVERKLAEGGMGSVYLAEDTNLGMRVVVKVPHARFLGEPGFRSRFRREIAELVRLEHPHVVRILARGEEDEVPFFVLQYLGGGSLEDRLKGSRQSPDGALAWLRPIAATLDFVHERSVVHRDVKPGNVLFDEQGHVFLSDFGVVKALGRDDGGAVTEVGTGVGSPVYMAPEQGMGKEVGGSADQYALAATLHEALSGAPPWGKGTPVEILVRKQKEDAPRLSASLPGLPAACDAAVARALSREPSERFPTCRAFADAFASGLAPRARPRKATWLVWSVGALALLLAVLQVPVIRIGFFGGEPSDSTPAPPSTHIVMLASAGAEPRRALRWKPAVGVEDRFTIHGTLDTTMRTDKGGFQVKMEYEQESRARVAEVVAGKARVDWVHEVAKARPVTMIVPSLPPEEQWRLTGKQEEIRKSEQEAYDALGVQKASTFLLPRGFALPTASGSEVESEASFAPPPAPRVLETVFPEEEIGVGAVWDVTSAEQFQGIRGQSVATYEVVSIEGDRVRLKVGLVSNAPAQDFSPPAARKRGDETMMRIKALTGTGTAELLLDLSRPIPLEFATRSTMTWTGEGKSRLESGPFTSEATVTAEMRRP
jgi:hypothetical protein